MPKQITFNIHERAQELPERSCDVVVFQLMGSHYYGITDVQYSHLHKAFNCGDHNPAELADERRSTWEDVEYWAYMDDVDAALKGLEP